MESSKVLRRSNDEMDDLLISRLHKEHRKHLEGISLIRHPLKTLKLFCLAFLQNTKQWITYTAAHGWVFLLAILCCMVATAILLTVNGPHDKHVDELICYVKYGVWWVGLGIASSIGLGSGLHTFVLYLGPHIAFFTLKATQCGRVDLKSAPYDTIQFNRAPSWLDKPCEEFGPSLFPHLPGSERFRVPLFSILPQIQLEAILWGVGTALGELPPYFVSKAAHLSGKKLETLHLDASLDEKKGFLAIFLARLKLWVFSKSQHLNFFTILLLASVPNPLFDLAGIMCGQLLVPFWKFFTATLIGKALIKTHIQTIFIVLSCNHQLLEWVENEVMLILEFIPGASHVLQHIMSALRKESEKFHLQRNTPSVAAKDKQWGFSFAFLWNTFIWIMLVSFFSKIITSTAQDYLREQQKKEIEVLRLQNEDKTSPRTQDLSNGASYTEEEGKQ